jgi:hypothetical protein
MWRILLVLVLLVSCTPGTDTPLPTLAPDVVAIRTLEPWVLASGMLNTPEETNEWQFVGRAGEQIRVRAVSDSANVSLTLMLRGAVLAEGASIDLTLPEDEIYRVRAQLISGSGQYDIGLSYTDRERPNPSTPLPQVVGVPTPTAVFIPQGEYIRDLAEFSEFSGLLTAQSSVHIYTYQGIAGDFISAELLRVAGTMDPLLTIYDRDGHIIAIDDNSGGHPDARLLNVRLPDSGLYSVQVSGQNLFGDYLLKFRTGEQIITADLVPTATATYVAPYVTPTLGAIISDTRLTDHAPAIGNLSRPGDFQRYAFAVPGGSWFSVRVQPYGESAVLPRFDVFGIEGDLIASSQTVGSADNMAFASRIQATETGAYIIIVTADNSSSGAFVIAAGTGDTVEDNYQGMTESNLRVSGTLTERGERHIWGVTLHPGEMIIAAASPQSDGIDPVLEIARADGSLLYLDDNSGENRAALIRSASIEEPATHILRVYDAGGDASGEYVLLWRYINRAITPTPIPPSTAILTISEQVAEGQYAFFAFQGRSGQRVVIDVRGKTGIDPVAVLLAPDGSIVAEGDDYGTSLDPHFEALLPQDGTYLVRVNGYLSGGEFDVSVALLLASP